MTLRPRSLILPLLLVLPLVCVSAQALQAAGLQQRMSSSEFKAAGLDKLSPQELANLDRWLQAHRHDKVVTRVVDASGKPVFYAGQKRRKIETHLVGHFGGWQGHNVMTLDNGQVWEQVGSETPPCMTSDHPAVKVKPSIMGNWLMYVHGCNDDVHVRRVR
ncbi:MAG: hypothetical protein KGJ63_11335 [Pseudomonadota bacterium]|nr:hypothetical protein [Pseudomonadota bacterium]